MLWVNGCRRASSQNRRAENAQKDVSSASPHLLDSYATSETFVCHGEQIQSYLCSAACSPLTVGLWGPGSLRPSPCTGHVHWWRQHLLPGLPTVLRAGAVLSAPSQHSPIWLFQIYINLQREEEGSRLTLCFRRRANSLQGREGLEGEGWRENGGKCLHLPQGGPAFPPRLSKAPGALFSRLVSPIVQPKSWKTGQNPWHPSDRCFHIILNFNTGQKESESGYKTTGKPPFWSFNKSCYHHKKGPLHYSVARGFQDVGCVQPGGRDVYPPRSMMDWGVMQGQRWEHRNGWNSICHISAMSWVGMVNHRVSPQPIATQILGHFFNKNNKQ